MQIKINSNRDDLLTIFGKETLKDRYLLPDESYQELFSRVACAYADNEEHAQRIYDYISKLWFMPATPVLSNGGTERGLPISCFLNSAHDNMEGIVDLWVENVWLAKNGGGIGSYWSEVRGLGEKVGKVGKTSGIMPFIRVMDSITLAVQQGSLRRGSAAVYLHVEHSEIEEFTELRRFTGGDPNRKAQNLHHGVVVSDAFMEAVERGDKWDLVSPATGEVQKTVEARDLWIRILTARVETGEPYLLFIDTVNKVIPPWHREARLKVKTSNLCCVAPETKTLTDKGDFEIQSLENQRVNVWNGEEYSEVLVCKTGTDQEVMDVHFSDGSMLTCTPYHIFYIQDEFFGELKVEAQHLKIGMNLYPWKMPNQNKIHPNKINLLVATRKRASIVLIEANNKKMDTYCFNEPIRHRGIFNGILTGQSEITLPTGIDHHSKDRTAVCCLSSLNLELFDEWEKDDQFIDDVMRFLDNVLTDFIQRAPDEMARAKYSAMRERSVGLGTMGFHSWLQKNNIPWESAVAKSWNMRIFKHICEKSHEASKVLAKEKGACPDAAEFGYEERFSYCMAVAPNASTSIITGSTSPGIEPIVANSFTHKTLSGSFTVRNRHLTKALETKGHNDEDTWVDIAMHGGSVQHLEFLSDREKSVFKTAFEIDQRWLIDFAGDRAPFIDQSQSLNIFLPANVHKRELHQLHMRAWKGGVKSLYYCRSMSLARGETSKTPPSIDEKDECLACQ